MEIGAAGWASQKAVLIIARGDLDICFYCHVTLSDETRTIDHVIPKGKGGTNDLENLCFACSDCNRDKGSLDAAEYLLYLRRSRAGLRAPKYPLLAKRAQNHLTQRLLVPWDHGHEEARERIADVKRNSKGYPDP